MFLLVIRGNADTGTEEERSTHFDTPLKERG